MRVNIELFYLKARTHTMNDKCQYHKKRITSGKEEKYVNLVVYLDLNFNPDLDLFQVEVFI